MWRPVPPAAVIACLRGRFAVLLITSCALALALTGGLILASSPTASAKGAALLTSSQAEPVAGGDQCEAPNWRAIAAQREAQRRFLVNNGGFGVAGSAGVTLAFMPGPVRTPRPLLLEDLQRQQGFATGLLSATIGRYSPAQMMLDISQGTRVASGLYRPSAPPVPAMALGQFGAGRIVGWEGYRARAADAPGELLPGLMAESVIGRGGSVSYVGTAGGSNTAAMAAAAGQCGILQSVSLGPQATLTARAEAAQGSSALTVVALPPGGYGVGALESLARTAPKRMIIVVQAPPDPARNRLLPLAVRGLGGDGGLKSPTTRRTGLVTGTDIAPTVLKQLGIVPPREMDGRPIEAASAMDAEQLEAMSDRLSL
ncbi:MAG: hypothetical protein JHC87_00365, partial [Thermoleophilaceae bacterium]|nr:hypothetical protein [Thermoleophilaceae bacterium]